MMNALRLTGGFEAGPFEARTGLRFEEVAPTLVSQQDRGLLRESTGAGPRPRPACVS